MTRRPRPSAEWLGEPGRKSIGFIRVIEGCGALGVDGGSVLDRELHEPGPHLIGSGRSLRGRQLDDRTHGVVEERRTAVLALVEEKGETEAVCPRLLALVIESVFHGDRF